MNKNSKIYVAGHRGLVGAAIVRNLQEQGYSDIITRTHNELDLTDMSQVDSFFYEQNIEYVFLAAAKVGGIKANNDYPADFIYQNLQIQNNVIYCAYKHKVEKLLFLGSSCIYPKACPQPIKEEYMLTGLLEPTNEPYAIAKIAGLKMCQSFNRQYGTKFISCMPTNLYGPYDNFDLTSSHVLPAMIRKFHEAKINNTVQVTLWGDGSPFREFLYVDDMADACIFLMDNYIPSDEDNNNGNMFFNLGTGKDLSIKELANLIKKTIGYEGDIICDPAKPNGTMKKLLDVSRLNNLGRKYKIELEDGITKTYEWFLTNYKNN